MIVEGFERSSIQRAVDSSAGCVVCLRAGTYTLDAPVVLRSGVTLVGAGVGQTIVELLPGANSHMFENADPVAGNKAIELRGLTLMGNMADQQKPAADSLCFGFGVFLRNVQGVVIEDLEALQVRQSALQFNQCATVRVSRVHMEEMGWSGIGAQLTDDLAIRDVVVNSSGLDRKHSAVHLDSGQRISVEASVTGCSGNGIMLDSTRAATADVAIESTVRECLRGVALCGSHEHRLSNVYVAGEYSHNRECGVMVANAANVFIVGARIESNGDVGVRFQGRSGGKHCLVADCVIARNPASIVERDASCDNFLVRNQIS